MSMNNTKVCSLKVCYQACGNKKFILILKRLNDLSTISKVSKYGIFWN